MPGQSQIRAQAPSRIVAESEKQWLFDEAELAQTPSIQDGMTQKEEIELRTKGIHFLQQVAIHLRIPQLTITTAAIFFQRFLMRASLKKPRNGIPKLHHYQSAATALFLATKVEESCRKMRELVQACCRVAQKNSSLIVDEQSKDFWRWRDCILENEDVLLETLCFDLTVESAHRQMYEMLKYYKIEHNKRLRNAAWAFITDSVYTQLCLLSSSRTIAAAALYAACRFCSITLPDSPDGHPWWVHQRVKIDDIRQAILYVTTHYSEAAGKLPSQELSQENNDETALFYAGLSAPSAEDAGSDSTRHVPDTSDQQVDKSEESSQQIQESKSPAGVKRIHDSFSNGDSESKRPRLNGDTEMKEADAVDTQPLATKRPEEQKRINNENAQTGFDTKTTEAAEGSEEGELEE